jgi:GTP cyclohydrolase FolE2
MPTEKMKRIEEAKKILEAQENGRFAEDLVRECAKRFPNSLYISSRCYESIHAHDAIATWSKKAGWAPLL